MPELDAIPRNRHTRLGILGFTGSNHLHRRLPSAFVGAVFSR